MKPRKEAKDLIGRRVVINSVSQREYGSAIARPVFGQRTGRLSDVGRIRCYLNYGTPKEFSAPWKMIREIKEA